MSEHLTSNLSAELRNPAYNDESDGHVRLRAAAEIDRLTARNAELEAEVRQLSRHIDRMASRPSSAKELAMAEQIGDLMKGAEKITARNAELVKALEEAQRDAERYRWLREWHHRWEVRYWTGSWWDSFTVDGLDTAIDAALKESAT